MNLEFIRSGHTLRVVYKDLVVGHIFEYPWAFEFEWHWVAAGGLRTKIHQAIFKAASEHAALLSVTKRLKA